MSEVRSYRDLKVWQRSMDIAVSIYGLTKSFPRDEQFGLVSQSRRAAVSVAANIAEGYGRSTKASYVHFLRIAQGSLKELETHLILASRVGISSEVDVDPILADADEVGRTLHALIKRLEAHAAP
ncbi:MAG: four helix bundle protein [Brevundimonas sp.]|uniref:four helix bundle protein n=1 Tax=Brevundimonas sp. TaxID=1871086 RepID=UPI002733097D|nr:four helix bundle protein [Brevundimonas sp.]MDP3403706.1 four helix bundle protein [Brevundimonas sp.]